MNYSPTFCDFTDFRQERFNKLVADISRTKSERDHFEILCKLLLEKLGGKIEIGFDDLVSSEARYSDLIITRNPDSQFIIELLKTNQNDQETAKEAP